MFTHYRTQGVVLHTRETREADRIFTVYTCDFGKIEVIGRSIRKKDSKLKMKMSLFSHIEMGFIQGKSCNTLTDVELISDFKEAKKNLGKLSLFYRISEITLLLVRGEEKDERVFSLLLDSLGKIDQMELSRSKLKLFFCFFSFRLLYFLGYKLYIKKCALCGEDIKKESYFNPGEGGVICKECFKEKPIGIYLEDIDSLKCFFEFNMEKVFDQDSKTFINVLENYLSFIPETQKRDNVFKN